MRARTTAVAATVGAWRHARGLWPRWTLLPPLPFFLWASYCFHLGERRWEHAALVLLVPALAYGSPRTRDLLRGAYPMALVGLLYDGMRFVKNVGLSADGVHLCDLRALELRLFGVTTAAGRLTVHDWLQPRANPLLDLYAAVPYGSYLFVCIGFAALLYKLDVDRARGVPCAEAAEGGLLARFAWSFLLLNVAGFVTYHLYPAAPPWYFHAHGCRVDLGVAASEGPNLARVDVLSGLGYFHAFYGRSNDVFGAVPSLHVAYPLLMLLVGRKVLGRGALLGLGLFAGSMCFAAVYLDHHWVVDVALGLVYAAVVWATVDRVLSFTRSRSRRRAASPR